MGDARKDRLPWLVLPGILLTLSGVTVLAPREAAQAAPSSPATVPAASSAIDDDGDGDELLEHWGDFEYVREERLQMAGIIGGFLLLGGLAYRRRVRHHASAVTVPLEAATEQRKAA